MVQMSSDDVRQRAYSEAVIARDSRAYPSGRHVFKKRDGGQAHAPELLDVRRPRDIVRFSAASMNADAMKKGLVPHLSQSGSQAKARC